MGNIASDPFAAFRHVLQIEPVVFHRDTAS